MKNYCKSLQSCHTGVKDKFSRQIVNRLCKLRDGLDDGQTATVSLAYGDRVSNIAVTSFKSVSKLYEAVYEALENFSRARFYHPVKLSYGGTVLKQYVAMKK